MLNALPDIEYFTFLLLYYDFDYFSLFLFNNNCYRIEKISSLFSSTRTLITIQKKCAMINSDDYLDDAIKKMQY